MTWASMATHGDHPELPEHLEALLGDDVHTVFLKADCPPRVKRGDIGALKLVEVDTDDEGWDTLRLERLEEDLVDLVSLLDQRGANALHATL